MKEFLLKACAKTFALGFLISAIAFIFQGVEILRLQDATGISLIAFIVFSVLNINGILYSYFIAKDKLLLIGTIINALACIFILTLKLMYGLRGIGFPAKFAGNF